MSSSQKGNIADLDTDGNVDYSDFVFLASIWGNSSQDRLMSPLKVDFDRDGLVNINDLFILSTNWLMVNLPIPTALWSMDDAAATTQITDSGGLNLHGNAMRNTSLLTTAGKVGTGITFNGTSDCCPRRGRCRPGSGV
jgi:hypothetical protein